MKLQDSIKWANDNSGLLSILIFFATILFGWVSGLFKSIIKTPRLKVRFINKGCFYCFFTTGKQYFHPALQENFDLHQTGFAVYMSIANVGNKPTSIDKIYIGYYKNSPKKKWFDRQITWLAQWHTFDNFKFEYAGGTILIPPLRVRNEYFMDRHDDSLGIGKSIVGIAYFEQQEAWGNLNPKNIDSEGRIRVIIRIRDVYGKNYHFKTILSPKNLQDAQKMNPSFGLISRLTSG